MAYDKEHPQFKILIDNLTLGMTLDDSCAIAHINPSTVYLWFQSQEPEEMEKTVLIKDAQMESKRRHIANIQVIANGIKNKRQAKNLDGTPAFDAEGKPIIEEYWVQRPSLMASQFWLERRHKDEFSQRTENYIADATEVDELRDKVKNLITASYNGETPTVTDITAIS